MPSANEAPETRSAHGVCRLHSDYTSNARQVVAEIGEVLDRVDPAEVERLVGELLAARRVFIYAVGRVLLSLECFGKRLNHLGIECQVVGAMDEQPIGPEDVMLIASGSGESKLPAEIARIAKAKGARLALITSASESTIKSLSDVVVHLPCPTKKEPEPGREVGSVDVDAVRSEPAHLRRRPGPEHSAAQTSQLRRALAASCKFGVRRHESSQSPLSCGGCSIADTLRLRV